MLAPKHLIREKVERKHPVKVTILGSTGSIGQSTLSIIAERKDLFQVVALSAHQNIDLFCEQIIQFQPEVVVLTDKSLEKPFKEKLKAKLSNTNSKPKILLGDEGLKEIAQEKSVDIVIAAILGLAGLKPVIWALESGKRVGLANKESLVAGGKLVQKALSVYGGELIPIDSEHSALFQLLAGHSLEEMRGITLTASGGPFFRTPKEDFPKILPQQALKHPKWRMGKKITIDSATLMNKGLELIEASWLFGCGEEAIEVVIHPQSIVHALLHLRDGVSLAHLSSPDMRAPISYALSYPELCFSDIIKPFSLIDLQNLEFFPIDHGKFPAISLARQCLKEGGAMPAVLNATNERAVSAFLQGTIGFHQIVELCKRALEKWTKTSYESIEELLDIDDQVRQYTDSVICEMS